MLTYAISVQKCSWRVDGSGSGCRRRPAGPQRASPRLPALHPARVRDPKPLAGCPESLRNTEASFHKQKPSQPNRYLPGAKHCTSGTDLTGMDWPTLPSVMRMSPGGVEGPARSPVGHPAWPGPVP